MMESPLWNMLRPLGVIASFNPQEWRTLELLLFRGYSNAQIARSLDVSASTVKHHFNRIVSRLQIRSDRPQIDLLLRLRRYVEQVDDERGKKLWDSLSPRTRQVAMLAVENLSSEEIARQLRISTRTVEQYLGNVRRAIKVPTNLRMVLWYLQRFPILGPLRTGQGSPRPRRYTLPPLWAMQ